MHDNFSRFGSNDVIECLLHPQRLASATLSLITDCFLGSVLATNQREDDGIVRHVHVGCPPQGHVSAMYPPY